MADADGDMSNGGGTTHGRPVQSINQVLGVPEEALNKFPHSKRVGNYLVGKSLGEGAFAKVKLGLHVQSGMQVAIKIISKDTIKNDAYMCKYYRREPKLLQLLVHPNIVQLYEVLETENSLYLVMELCDGGDLVQRIKHIGSPLNETDTRSMMRQLLSAIDYIHRIGILHRDLKAENFLLAADSSLKLTDFGLSTVFSKQVTVTADGRATVQRKQFLHQTQCGSPAYASPEVLSQQTYCQPADVWSLGVNMFYMLHNKLPFMVEPFSMNALLKKVRTYDIEPIRTDLTPGCVDLLRRLLCLDQNERITVSQAMQHPWIVLNAETGVLEPLESYKVTKATIVHSINRSVLKYMCSEVQRAKTMIPFDIIQIISSNTPHELNATYHLLAKKLNKFCESNSTAVDQFDVFNDTMPPISPRAVFSRQSTDVLIQSSSIVAQRSRLNTPAGRVLQRPQTNRLVALKKTLSQQAIDRQSVPEPLSAFPLLSELRLLYTNSKPANFGASNYHVIAPLVDKDQQTEIIVKPIGSAHHKGSVFTAESEAKPKTSVSIDMRTQTESKDQNGNLSVVRRAPVLKPVSSGRANWRNYSGNNVCSAALNSLQNALHCKQISPSLPEVNEISCSVPAAPVLSRATSRPYRLDEVGLTPETRLSAAGSGATKLLVTHAVHQRTPTMTSRSEPRNTIGFLHSNLAVSAAANKNTYNLSQSQSRAATVASQPRSVQFASRLATNFLV